MKTQADILNDDNHEKAVQHRKNALAKKSDSKRKSKVKDEHDGPASPTQPNYFYIRQPQCM